MTILELLLGLVLLAAGGELLIRGAVLLARLAGLTPAVIGLTVVAAGTSLPELTVSVLAALRGEPDLAVGNVVGSNIFNVTIAIGLTALVSPLVVHGTAVRLEWPVMFLSSAACIVLMRDALLDRPESGLLLLSLVAFMAYMVRIARQEVGPVERGEFSEEVSERLPPGRRREAGMALGALAVGVLILVVGGRFLVEGAVGLARIAGMSERVIGLTVVAAGTGMPELATSLVAAARKQSDVAVANMIGSNVFNLLGILSITALASPIRISPHWRGPTCGGCSAPPCYSSRCSGGAARSTGGKGGCWWRHTSSISARSFAERLAPSSRWGRRRCKRRQHEERVRVPRRRCEARLPGRVAGGHPGYEPSLGGPGGPSCDVETDFADPFSGTRLRPPSSGSCPELGTVERGSPSSGACMRWPYGLWT